MHPDAFADEHDEQGEQRTCEACVHIEVCFMVIKSDKILGITYDTLAHFCRHYHTAEAHNDR